MTNLWQCALISFVLSAFISCEVPDDIPTLVVGQDFTNTNVRIIRIDTMQVELSTFKFDSIVTSNTDRLLIGRYNDEFFGTVESSTYMEFSAGSFSLDLDPDAELDSVALILGYDGYFYNDTLAVSTINVHLLEDFVNPEEATFYNTSSISYQLDALASFSYEPEPNEDSIYIELPYEFGNDLFQEILNNNIQNNDDLVQEFRGFTLKPSLTSNSSITGFSSLSTETYLRFYYSVPDEFDQEDELFFDFVVSSGNNKRFNSISNNPNNTNLVDLVDQEINLYSNNSDNLSYLQAGTAYAMRIEFPTVETLNDIPGTGTILDATLNLFPNENSFSDLQPIRDSLSLNFLDQNNEVSGQISNSLGFVYATLQREEGEFNRSYYEIPVTEYLDFELNPNNPEVEDALVLLLNDYASSVDRVVFNDSSFPDRDSQAQLIITYAIYDED